MKLVLIDGNSLLFRAYYATSYHEINDDQGDQPPVYALSIFLLKF